MTGLDEIKPQLSRFARTLRRALGRARRSRRYRRQGIEGVAMELRTMTSGHAGLLRARGAAVGRGCSIAGPIHIANANGSFVNLVIGDRVRLGPDLHLDLTDRVTIGDDATLAMRCTIVTHTGGGNWSADAVRPLRVAPVIVGPGASLAADVTLLPGVTVGAGAKVGPRALVGSEVGAGSGVVTPPSGPLIARSREGPR